MADNQFRSNTIWSTAIDGEILTVANDDLGNANTSYTYFDLNRAGFNSFTLFFTVQATTLTLEGCNDGPDVPDASGTWVDLTTTLTGAANATASGGWIVDTPISVGRIRIKRLTTNATNALKLFLVRGK